MDRDKINLAKDKIRSGYHDFYHDLDTKIQFLEAVASLYCEYSIPGIAYKELLEEYKLLRSTQK